ncbi:MAG: Autotransporter adhesin [Myxococcaceae bacterium]|nr:Autotransporter adhesin [Myxococcaceae bacterium]
MSPITQRRLGPLAASILVLATAACSLLVDTAGLAGRPAVAVTDAGSLSSGPTDGGVESGAPIDASRDADAAGAADAAPSIAETYAAAVLSDGPSMYLRLDETGGATAVDATGAHDGHYFGSVRHGVPGAFPGSTAMGLDGNGGIDAGPIFDFDGVKPMTLEAWHRSTKIDMTYRFIFAKEVTDSMNRRQEYGVFLQSPDGFYVERYVNDVSASAGTDLPAPGGGFHHVVATYDGAKAFFWVDGAVVGSFDDTRSATTKPGRSFCVGAHDPSYGALYGDVDDAAVYEKALTPARILAHYAAAGR